MRGGALGKANGRQAFDSTALARAMRLCVLMNDHIRNMAPPDRDRMMQVHLAEARGPEMNAQLLRHAMNFAIRIRVARAGNEVANHE